MVRVSAHFDDRHEFIWFWFFVSRSTFQTLLSLLRTGEIPYFFHGHPPLYEEATLKPYELVIPKTSCEILFQKLPHLLEQLPQDKILAEEFSIVLKEWKRVWKKTLNIRWVLKTPAGILELGHPPLIMGILNVTPDSFYDGGQYNRVDKALKQAVRLYEEGADIIDIGGQSTRPGSQEIPPDEEWKRIEPILIALRKTLPIPLSIDTYSSFVADKALTLGADMINDVTAGLYDKDMVRVVRYHGVPIVLMHFYKTIRPMPKNPVYKHVVKECIEFLEHRIEFFDEHGVDVNQIIVDPGIGFGKSPEQNLILLRYAGHLHTLGRPVLIGPSRKSFMKKAHAGDAEERLEGTISACLQSYLAHANILRVHDVWPIRKALSVWMAIEMGSYSKTMPWTKRGTHDRI